MNKLVVFSLHACDDYSNSELIKTRYFLSEETGLIDTPVGLENVVNLIFETIERCKLVVQKITFEDPHLKGKDYLSINLPCWPKSGFSRMRPLSSKEREDFCRFLSKKMNEIALTKEEEEYLKKGQENA